MKKYLCLFMSMLLLTSLYSVTAVKKTRSTFKKYDNTEETELLLGLW